jgi:type I restriction enzyme S subunit
MGQSPDGQTYNTKRNGAPLLNGPTEFGPQYPVAKQWTTAPTKFCRDGDILYCVRGTVGRMNWADQSYCMGRGLAAIRASMKANASYIWFALRTVTAKVLEESAGSTFPSITGEKLASVLIPLPPLIEQERIAARLRDVLVEVEKARHALQSQLDAAEKLPSALLGQRFGGDTAQRWPRRKLGDVLRLRKDIVHPRNQPKGTTIFVGLEHVESLTGRRIGGLSIDMAALTGRKPRFYPGDVVYGYLRPYLNKVWLADREGLCSVDQYVYSVNDALADAEFVAWFMRSPVYRSRAPVSLMQSQLPRIRTDEVAAVELNLPNLKEQRKFARVVEGEVSEAIGIAANLRTRLEAIEKLPAALLREVFSSKIASS